MQTRTGYSEVSSTFIEWTESKTDSDNLYIYSYTHL